MKKFYTFEDLPTQAEVGGGKAQALARMRKAGFPVPAGAVLTETPSSEQEWKSILDWWQSIDYPILAVRSSAKGEDSKDASFAGQNSSYLEITNEEQLREAVAKCFASGDREASKVYQKHFLKNSDHFQMNVILQEMVDAKFSGVFFSTDPRSQVGGSWLLEYIEGLGEDLVSGKKTPNQIKAMSDVDLTNAHPGVDLSAVVGTGLRLRLFFGTEVDMEWSIDRLNRFYVLQSRPITTLDAVDNHFIRDTELQSLRTNNEKSTLWDGRTFAEFSGIPTEFTYSVWSLAFSHEFAFGKALQYCGYKSFHEDLKTQSKTLLDRVFGRMYVNLSTLLPLYFGPLPYQFVLAKKPKLKFSFSKLNLVTIIQTPLTLFRMWKVAWKLSTKRSDFLVECAKAFAEQTQKFHRPLKPEIYSTWNENELKQQLKKEVYGFASDHLYWPLILITLIESTEQGLLALLERIYGLEKAEGILKHWMSRGLKTDSKLMNDEFKQAVLDQSRRPFFMSKYGHRAPGELELARPRWLEWDSDRVFGSAPAGSVPLDLASDSSDSVETEISAMNSYLKEAVRSEWRLLKQMLEYRESWKMLILSPYAEIRLVALELGKRLGLGEDIFFLSIEEILEGTISDQKIFERKQKSKAFQSMRLPDIISYDQLEKLFSESDGATATSAAAGSPGNGYELKGESLSEGLVFGEVRVVKDIASVDTSTWPSNVILVAESTDPGWTPLFLHCSGIVVEKGGVLSHSAILARELRIPAVGGVQRCYEVLKDGDRIRIDGNRGVIRHEEII